MTQKYEVEPTWGAKVQELAERGIELGAILDFYALLGSSIMPHFDPRTSTTTDVVRQAIIPLSWQPAPSHPFASSKCLGSAYATVVRNGQPALAHRMVSHNWGNLFTHVVAAIVADALDTPTFGDIIDRLSLEGLSSLRAELEQKGSLTVLYWVCIFSVNQHSCICGSFGPEPPVDTADFKKFDALRRDKVTGCIYPLCTCPVEKHFNSHPVQCEMNKFDAVMAFLLRHSTNLRQVVAVDVDLDVFNRAWVVAELVEARKLCMTQRMKVSDMHSLRKAGNVQRIRVENCQAARPEDVREILAKIDDIPQFNKDLEALIFNDNNGLIAEVLERMRAEDTSSTAPLFNSTLRTLKVHGNPQNLAHWIRRDMWITLDRSLCYFSMKENKRLVLIPGSALAKAEISQLKGTPLGDCCFEVKTSSGSAEPGTTYLFAAESSEDLRTWLEMLNGSASEDGCRFSQAVMDKDQQLQAIKLAVRNRRMTIDDDSMPTFAGVLWKLVTQGDPSKVNDWIQRDFWLVEDGALCYWSQKEERSVQYYTRTDLEHATICRVANESFCRPWSFQVCLPNVNGLQLAPGNFAAESEETREKWMHEFAKLGVALR